MIIQTNKGERIETSEAPRWNEFHRCYYVTGRRWIRTKQKFSSSELIHNFEAFTEEGR